MNICVSVLILNVKGILLKKAAALRMWVLVTFQLDIISKLNLNVSFGYWDALSPVHLCKIQI